MLMETAKRADIHIDLSPVVQELTQIVEREVKAFQSLLEALVAQQQSIIKGDALSVSISSEEVERIVARTKELERERTGKSREITKQLDVEKELTLTQLIPLVEERYADRLQELKEMVIHLSKKIQTTNERNRFLLENSLRFVDKSLRILMEGRGARGVSDAYDKNGKVGASSVTVFRGVG